MAASPTIMDRAGAAKAVLDWLSSEGLQAREVEDPQASIHLHVKYPPTKQGHMFNIVIPKKRRLVLVYSITRVDQGQQEEMSDMGSSAPIEWEGWLHETRVRMTQSDLDWVLHVGKKKDGVSGPLQAFNLSRPVWFDGLTQNEFMQTMRKVWLTKLSLIHQIKFGFGPGIGKPGPVDDWVSKTKQVDGGPSQTVRTDIDTDESGGFGKDFDPMEWA